MSPRESQVPGRMKKRKENGEDCWKIQGNMFSKYVDSKEIRGRVSGVDKQGQEREHLGLMEICVNQSQQDGS